MHLSSFPFQYFPFSFPTAYSKESYIPSKQQIINKLQLQN